MTVDHPHVGAIAVEPNELLSAVTETPMIVTGHTHVLLEQREAANSAAEAFRGERHLQSPYACGELVWGRGPKPRVHWSGRGDSPRIRAASPRSRRRADEPAATTKARLRRAWSG